jgi:hypothetical protein
MWLMAKDNLCDVHIIYANPSSDENVRKEYRKFVQEMLQKNKAMSEEVHRRTIYGGDDFIQRVHKKFKIDAVIKKRGRPKKEAIDKQE